MNILMTPLEHENFRYVVKCDWVRCVVGIHFAGTGRCALGGDWKDKDCMLFIADKEWEAE